MNELGWVREWRGVLNDGECERGKVEIALPYVVAGGRGSCMMSHGLSLSSFRRGPIDERPRKLSTERRRRVCAQRVVAVEFLDARRAAAGRPTPRRVDHLWKWRTGQTLTDACVGNCAPQTSSSTRSSQTQRRPFVAWRPHVDCTSLCTKRSASLHRAMQVT